eukprot:CAMPEP_0194052790 /NCGR_PEP_ID=MMETSP0009_2-20130614/47002_1 /TAXON_ID=210454 /ORGANISM="Grammatophora oceanica, Strain CCMP 410" /LENGTH=158 /DNA_ID=CAMNT_0038700551 /DNA_START=66 /DNA_END=542 /DNA_ORIENTATION=-
MYSVTTTTTSQLRGGGYLVTESEVEASSQKPKSFKRQIVTVLHSVLDYLDEDDREPPATMAPTPTPIPKSVNDIIKRRHKRRSHESLNGEDCDQFSVCQAREWLNYLMAYEADLVDDERGADDLNTKRNKNETASSDKEQQRRHHTDKGSDGPWIFVD